MSALAQIVGIGVDNHGASNDAISAKQSDLRVADGDLGGAIASSLDVAQVAQVTVLIAGGAVLLAVGLK